MARRRTVRYRRRGGGGAGGSHLGTYVLVGGIAYFLLSRPGGGLPSLFARQTSTVPPTGTYPGVPAGTPPWLVPLYRGITQAAGPVGTAAGGALTDAIKSIFGIQVPASEGGPVGTVAGDVTGGGGTVNVGADITRPVDALPPLEPLPPIDWSGTFVDPTVAWNIAPLTAPFTPLAPIPTMDLQISPAVDATDWFASDTSGL